MKEMRSGVETCNTVKRLALLLAAVVAACAFAGSASAAGNPFGVTVVRFSPQTTPAQMRQAVNAAGGVVVTDLSAIDALAVVDGEPRRVRPDVQAVPRPHRRRSR